MTDFGINLHFQDSFWLKIFLFVRVWWLCETCREAQLRHRQINSLAYKIVYVYVFPTPNERNTTKD